MTIESRTHRRHRRTDHRAGPGSGSPSASLASSVPASSCSPSSWAAAWASTRCCGSGRPSRPPSSPTRRRDRAAVRRRVARPAGRGRLSSTSPAATCPRGAAEVPAARRPCAVLRRPGEPGVPDGCGAAAPRHRRTLPAVADAFATARGVEYADFGDELRFGIAELNRPGVPLAMSAAGSRQLPDIAAQLDRGGIILDAGCGEGWSTIGLARAFPAATRGRLRPRREVGRGGPAARRRGRPRGPGHASSWPTPPTRAPSRDAAGGRGHPGDRLPGAARHGRAGAGAGGVPGAAGRRRRRAGRRRARRGRRRPRPPTRTSGCSSR